MTDTDFRDRILADLKRVEEKLDSHGETLATIRERLRAVEVRSLLLAGLVSIVLTIILRKVGS